jgi:type IV pilus assembly protein PilA
MKMSFIKNRKGFTLVELLVVIVILGIITLMSFPVIRNISNKTENSKFDTYKKTLISSAKLYVKDYSEDLFGHNESGCAYVSYSDLNKKGLIKDINVSGYTCNSEHTFIKVIKVGDQFNYSSYLYCSKGNAKVILPTSETAYEQEESCTIETNTSFGISASPSKDNSISNKTTSTSIRISSYAGINRDTPPQVGYAWTTSSELNDSIGTLNYTDLTFTIPTKEEQDNTRLGGNAVTVKSSKIFTPSGQTGEYYLVVKINSIVNYNGESYSPKSEDTDVYTIDGKYYKIFGPYKIDNTPPEILDTTVLSSSNDNYNNNKPNLKLYVKDNSTETKDIGVCLSYTNSKCKTFSTYNEIINVTELIGDIPNFTYNGSTYYVYVTIKDKAGNTATKKLSYKSYKSCDEVINNGDWYDYTSCGSCGIATKTQKRKTKDKYLGTACTTKTQTVNCSYPNCCSKTTIVQVNSTTTSCSLACGGGKQTTTNTYKEYSYYDTSYVCNSNIVTQYQSSCNNIPCTPYISETTDGITYTCDNNDEYTTSPRTCNLKWPSSGDATFYVKLHTVYTGGEWYKYAYNSQTNQVLCNFATGCTSGINNGYFKMYFLNSKGQQSPIITVNVSR